MTPDPRGRFVVVSAHAHAADLTLWPLLAVAETAVAP